MTESFKRWHPEEIRARNGAVLTTRYIAETHYDALAAQLALLRQHLGTLTPGGSHTCITCAAHVKVIIEDLEPVISRLSGAIEDYLDGESQNNVSGLRQALAFAREGK